MTKKEKEALLSNPKAIEEVKRHLWIESEKQGYDIGYDNAAQDWLERFGVDWAKANMPKKKASKPKTKKTAAKRAAKTYL